MGNLITAIDTSSAQPQDLSTLIAQYRPQHVVVKLYQRVERRYQSWTIAQAASAKASGCSVGGYVWLYRDVPVDQQIGDALEIAARAGITLPILLIDAELYTDGTYPSAAQCEQAANRAVIEGVPPGGYTGKWFWEGYLHNPTVWAGIPLWDAAYDFTPTLDGFVPYGGWTERKGHQYSAREIDLSVFDPALTTIPGPPPADHVVGPGILSAMAAAGDTPTGDEIYCQSSYAVGASGARYVYLNSDNRTYRVQP